MARLNRISQQFWPESYKLELTISEDLLKLSGKLEIIGYRRSKPSNRITLNQAGIKVSTAKLYILDKNSETEIPVQRIVHHNKLQELRLHTASRLESAKYRIELTYQTTAQQKSTNGVYISSWHDDSNQMHKILTTQFETHYSRTLLPCIDEPEAKAIFNLTLIQPERSDLWQTLFNVLPETISVEKGSQVIVFKPTPKMSTYLLALTIGELASVSANTKRNIPVSVFCTPNKIQHAKYALDFAIKTIDFLEEYFKIPYPLEKCDLVAVPDLDAGGMENWGLITFREDLLLFDEALSTLADKQCIATVIAHEIAHQWFGNLVTMKWWDELWLNEGFANFMEFFIVDKLQPEWNIFEDYLILEKNAALRLDSIPSSKPIVKKIHSVHQVVDAFDEITYEKSGSVIRMIYSVLGDQSFKEGLKLYFEQFKYSSATSIDLLSSWQKFTTIDLQAFTHKWIYEPGLPLIDVSLGNNPSLIKLEQKRFLSDQTSSKDLKEQIVLALKQKPNLKKKQKKFYENNLLNSLTRQDSQVWQVPIDFVASTTQNQISAPKAFILKNTYHKVQLSKKQSLPLKLNKNGQGFYITQYSIEFLAQISQAITKSELSNLDTLNLLSDFISLNRAGLFKPGPAAILDLILSSKNSSSAHFWGLTGGFLAYIHHHLRQSDQDKALSSYVCQLIETAKSKFGITPDDHEVPNITKARFEILSLGAMALDKDIYTHFLKLYDTEDISNIHPEQRLLSLFCVAKRGKLSDYNALLDLYKTSYEDINLREDLTYALTTFEGERYAKLNLTILQDSELVRTQDILSWISLILTSSSLSKKVMLDWLIIQDGWQWLLDNLSPFDLSSVVRVIISSAYNKRELNKLLKFFNTNYNDDLQKSISEATDMAKSRINWHKKELPKVLEYLTSDKFVTKV